MPQSSSGSGRKTNICQKLSTRQALAGCFNTQSHFMLLLTCLTGETKVAQGHPASSSTSRSKPRCSWPPCACFFFFFFGGGGSPALYWVTLPWLVLAFSGNVFHSEVHVQWFLMAFFWNLPVAYNMPSVVMKVPQTVVIEFFFLKNFFVETEWWERRAGWGQWRETFVFHSVCFCNVRMFYD